MSKFSKGEWEFDTELCFVKNKKGDEIAELFWDKDDGDKEERLQANGRLIAAAPKMYDYLKRICDFYRGTMLVCLHTKDGKLKFADIEALLARIDGEEKTRVRTLDEISKDMGKLLREAYEAGKEETRVISKRAFCEWLRNNREKIEKMLNEEEVKHD